MTTSKSKVEFYDSIDVLNLERFSMFNKFIMLDAEIGATVFDFDKIVVRVHEFIDKELFTEAKNELMNLRLVVNNILTGNSPKGLAFASLIKKINGKEVTDYSDANLKAILNRLSTEGLEILDVHKTIEQVKKK